MNKFVLSFVSSIFVRIILAIFSSLKPFMWWASVSDRVFSKFARSLRLIFPLSHHTRRWNSYRTSNSRFHSISYFGNLRKNKSICRSNALYLSVLCRRGYPAYASFTDGGRKGSVRIIAFSVFIKLRKFVICIFGCNNVSRNKENDL